MPVIGKFVTNYSSQFYRGRIFFAKNLYNELKIPVGLINSSWGGTNIETWISREAFENSDEFKEMIAGMPKIDLDSLSKLKVKGSVMRIEALQGTKMEGMNTSQFRSFHLMIQNGLF